MARQCARRSQIGVACSGEWGERQPEGFSYRPWVQRLLNWWVPSGAPLGVGLRWAINPSGPQVSAGLTCPMPEQSGDFELRGEFDATCYIVGFVPLPRGGSQYRVRTKSEPYEMLCVNAFTEE